MLLSKERFILKVYQNIDLLNWLFHSYIICQERNGLHHPLSFLDNYSCKNKESKPANQLPFGYDQTIIKESPILSMIYFTLGNSAKQILMPYIYDHN